MMPFGEVSNTRLGVRSLGVASAGHRPLGIGDWKTGGFGPVPAKNCSIRSREPIFGGLLVPKYAGSNDHGWKMAHDTRKGNRKLPTSERGDRIAKSMVAPTLNKWPRRNVLDGRGQPKWRGGRARNVPSRLNPHYADDSESSDVSAVRSECETPEERLILSSFPESSRA